MSHSMENKSKISSAKITIDLNLRTEEIEDASGTSFSPSGDDPEQHIHLANILREVISEKISILEAMQQEQVKQEDLVKNAATTATVNQMDVPSQSQMTENTSENAIIVATPEDLATGKKAYKGKNPILGQLFDVNFNVPEDCIAAKIDRDKIAEINTNRLGSFAERLQGWNIERRQHLMTTKSAPRIDWSFKHSSSKREFRSVAEVVRYILYETYPRSPNKDNMMIPDEDMTEEVSTVNPKRESTSICCKTEKAKSNKEIVEEFLRESWLNLMTSINSEGDNKQEENQEFLHVDVDDKSVESETTEKMTEAVYNDMVDNANKTNVVMNDNDEDMTEEVSTVNPKRESTSICCETEKAKSNKEIVEEFLRESWLNLMTSINSEGDNKQEENQEFLHVDVDDKSVESETTEKMTEAVYNDMVDNANKTNVVMNDNDEDMTEEVSTVNPKRESTSICCETEKAKSNKEIVEEFLRESWLNLMTSINSEGDNMQEENQEFLHVDVDDKSVESETTEKMTEAVYNDMVDNANKTNVVMNDNDGKETASEADPEQVQGTPSKAQASNKNMSPHSED